MSIAKVSFNHFFQGETWRFLPGDQVPDDIANDIGNKSILDTDSQENPEKNMPAIDVEEEESFSLYDYQALNMKQLRALLKERQIEPASYSKANMISALEAFDAT